MDLPYHDAKLRGIQIQENGDVILSFASANGDAFRCMLRGVKHFCCDNFREGNTVFDRRLTDTPTVMANDLRKLLFASPNEAPPQLASLRAMIDRRDFSFYKLVASYGATVLAICDSIEERLG